MKFKHHLFVTFLLILFGCHDNVVMRQLELIDSIGMNGKDELALAKLDSIVPESIDDEGAQAYYWLLKMRTEIRLKKSISSTNSLDKAIQYYENTSYKSKLARAYGYKATILGNNGDIRQAIVLLKKAEQLVKGNEEELALANDIFSALAYINLESKEYAIALKYGHEALRSAYQLKQDQHIAYALMQMYICYHETENADSASYYLEKFSHYVEKVPDAEKPHYYNNIGLALIDKDLSAAENYLMKAYQIQANAYTFKGLARVFEKKGEKEKAHQMWKMALSTENLHLKSEVLRAMYDSQHAEGRYQEASETAIKIVEIQDSIAHKEKEEDVRGLQLKVELEHEARIKSEYLIMLLSFVGMLLSLSLALVFYLYGRIIKSKTKLLENQQILERYRAQLVVLQQEGKAGTKEVEHLSRKIAELQQKQNAQLQNGRERYEEIMAGGTTIRWTRNDFSDSIEHYRTIDSQFVTHMETDYNHLSAKYIFFAIMEQLGKTDEELQHIMAVSQNTIRSIRSRINSAKQTNDND